MVLVLVVELVVLYVRRQLWNLNAIVKLLIFDYKISQLKKASGQRYHNKAIVLLTVFFILSNPQVTP